MEEIESDIFWAVMFGLAITIIDAGLLLNTEQLLPIGNIFNVGIFFYIIFKIKFGGKK